MQVTPTQLAVLCKQSQVLEYLLSSSTPHTGMKELNNMLSARYSKHLGIEKGSFLPRNIQPGSNSFQVEQITKHMCVVADVEIYYLIWLEIMLVILAHAQCFVHHLAPTIVTVLRRISPEAWYQSAELSESEMTV